MSEVEEEIRSIVDAETGAWNARDADALVSLFHPDTVWPWPPNADAHDPMTWVLFETHDLIRNDRKTLRVVVSEQGDGAFAVVDLDTLRRNRASHEPFHWKGRACKVYTKVGSVGCSYFRRGCSSIVFAPNAERRRQLANASAAPASPPPPRRRRSARDSGRSRSSSHTWRDRPGASASAPAE
jgi:ketosteroid isomerase-like protein